MEHLLAKEGVAGSIPVSRSHNNKKVISFGYHLFCCFEPNTGLEVQSSTLRFGPRKTEVHRTSCAVSRLNKKGSRETVLAVDVCTKCKLEIDLLASLLFDSPSGLEVQSSTLRFGPRNMRRSRNMAICILLHYILHLRLHR